MNSKVIVGIRILVGVMMIVFGVGKFANFIPPPEGDMKALMDGLGSTFLGLIGVLEIVFGLLLVIGKYIPLSLTVLVAIMLNASIFHLIHDPSNAVGAVVFLVLCIVLVTAHKDRFKNILIA